MEDLPPPEFEAWSDSEVPSKPQGRSARSTGVMLIGGVMGMMMCMLGLMVGWNFGVVRPRQERIVEGTATGRVEATTTAAAEATEIIQRTADYSAGYADMPADWELVLDEDFETDDLWFVGMDESPYGTSDVSIEDGRLHWEVTTKRGIFTYRTPDLENERGVDLSDFAVSVETKVVEHSTYGGNIGIIFRQNGPRYYVFNVSQNGYYALNFHDQTGWEQVIEWTELPEYVGEPPYKLMVRGEGEQFFFFINDLFLIGAQDDRIHFGRVGISIDLSEAAESIAVEFDNMMMYAPPEARPEPTPTVDIDELTPTSVPNPNSTMIVLPAGWERAYTATFRTGDTEWEQPTRMIGTGEVQASMDEGWLVWDFSGEEGALFVMPLVGVETTTPDGYLEVKFTSRGAFNTGVIFRQQDGQAYYFEIDRDNVASGGVIRNGVQAALFHKESPFTRRYPENTMGVMVRGSEFRFYFNGETIGQFENDSLSAGAWGLSVSLKDEVSGGRVRFDNVLLYTP